MRSVSQKAVIRVLRRVLRLLDMYLAMMPQDTLHAAGGGVMTIRELRQHIKFALLLRAKRKS